AESREAGTASEPGVRGRPAVRRSGQRLRADGCERDGRGGCGGGHEQPAEKRVATALRQQQPGRACAEEGNREHAPAEVVGAEEGGAPAGALGCGLAGGGDGEEEKAGGPERLLAGAAAAQRTQQQ